ncbi:MAG: hypothetical protein WCJ19_04375 [bacterium]
MQVDDKFQRNGLAQFLVSSQLVILEYLGIDKIKTGTLLYGSRALCRKRGVDQDEMVYLIKELKNEYFVDESIAKFI